MLQPKEKQKIFALITRIFFPQFMKSETLSILINFFLVEVLLLDTWPQVQLTLSYLFNTNTRFKF